MTVARGSQSFIETVEWARDALLKEEESPTHVLGVEKGSQADIVILGRDIGAEEEGPRFALKIFSDKGRRTGSTEVTSEFEALKKFHRALEGNSRSFYCPRPIELSPSGRAYLMSFSAGRRLDRYRTHNRAERVRIVTAILEGLSVYYECVGGLYADFQPANILIDGEFVTFIDPTLAGESHEWVASQLMGTPASGDIGYWLYSVAARAPKSFILRPAQTMMLFAVTEELLGRAQLTFTPSAESGWLIRQVEMAARIRLGLLNQRSSLKGPFLAFVGRWVIRRILRRASRPPHSR